MKVFKFGGASIASASAIRNMADIINGFSQDQLVVVVSAMGKSTNALEKILSLKINRESYYDELTRFTTFHKNICSELSLDCSPFQDKISALILELEKRTDALTASEGYNYSYDQIVSYGELISSTIIANYLNSQGHKSHWIDARKLIRTDNRFREAKINWDITKQKIVESIPELVKSGIILTQGFIGGTSKNETTTLGREGSDFTGAIFSYCLDAESLTIWKDVPGILNGDPKRISNTLKYHQLSYQEAAEMTYYGASVIHPKTIKPLANKSIPLYVKSFESPGESGTAISESGKFKPIPAIIFKDNQVLISFHVKNLAFIDEKNLSIIFHLLAELNIKINVMQNSAVSLSICTDDEPQKVKNLINTLKYDFRILFNDRLLLITVKNYDQASIDNVSMEKKILLEQRTRQTYQIVVEADQTL